MYSQALVGERVRQLRVINNISATDLAAQIQISSGNMSLIENGRHPLDEQLLGRLARVLGCTPTFFGVDGRVTTASRPWLRAYADASKRAVDRIENDNQLAVEMIGSLGLVRIPDSIPIFDGDLDDDHAIEEAADRTRTVLGQNEGDVIRNAVRATERLGCLVLPLDDELGRHLGMSQRVDGVPLIRVSRSSEDPHRQVPGDRQRFTVLHELGHLCLHHACPPPNTPAEAARYEKQAHRFAAAFLAPADPLVADLEELGGRITLNTLAHLKQRWGIAVKALVVRFRHLGMIDEAAARSLYKQISARKWNTQEPVRVPNERAQWFDKALTGKLGRDATTLAAERSGLGPAYFDRWIDWSPAPSENDLADVVTMTPRSGTATNDDDAEFGTRPVTQLSIRPW
jgi:Zn-dependent peptidase ImmA (M78 family)/DNA-binding Xre family transcriptional regulator